MAKWVVKDGVVGHWARWYLLCTAMLVLLTPILKFVYMFAVAKLHLDWPVLGRELYDYHDLFLSVPLGILLGESGYEKDRKLNSPKADSLQDRMTK